MHAVRCPQECLCALLPCLRQHHGGCCGTGFGYGMSPAARRPGAASAACPCGGGPFADCCGPYLDGSRLPARADQLLRSRYTAYVRGDTAYLRTTWDPATCPETLEDSQPPQWLGLK